MHSLYFHHPKIQNAKRKTQNSKYKIHSKWWCPSSFLPPFSFRAWGWIIVFIFYNLTKKFYKVQENFTQVVLYFSMMCVQCTWIIKAFCNVVSLSIKCTREKHVIWTDKRFEFRFSSLKSWASSLEPRVSVKDNNRLTNVGINEEVLPLWSAIQTWENAYGTDSSVLFRELILFSRVRLRGFVCIML